MSDATKPWRIEIVAFATGEVERTLRYTTERLAERAERGVERQMDPERYYTRIMGPEDT